MSTTPIGNGHTPLIRVSGLRKTYKLGQQLVHALNGVDLSVEEGEFMVVMGPSGSGKSTLLYLVGGLDRATAGSVDVAGVSIEHLDENALADYRRRQIGFVFQTFNLIPTMTAEQNVAYPMRFVGISRKARNARARQLLEQVGLGNRFHHRPTELSGGQQQRVAVARALVNDPHIILADEPTGNLDTASGSEIMSLLSQLNRQGRTVLIVTHDPRGAQYATHTVRLLDGRVENDE
ncbi:MAG: ABC transporter ATP-binding protein [Anaerolineae bacterium]